jgi:hypothetical protein
MKEGALSAPIIYYERDVRSQEGNFMPKVQTKKISKVFAESKVKLETKYQTINTFQEKLQKVQIDIKAENEKEFQPLNQDFSTGGPIK